MLSKIFLFILIFVFTQNIYAQNSDDCCEKDSKRILEMFDKFRGKYIKLIKDTLQSRLINDTILKKQVVGFGKIDLDKYDYRIIPVLKWSKDAQKYTKADNICNFFDIDTIYYTCKVGLFIDTTLFFYCEIGNVRCILSPGSDDGTPPLKFNFYAEYFNNCDINYSKCFSRESYLKLKELFINNNGFRFEVDGITSYINDYFVISNGRMRVYRKTINTNDEDFNLNGKCPNDYAKVWINEKTIRNCACLSPSYKIIPWWKFWDWDIFH